MTNEQTALLMRQIADRVRALAAEVEPLIHDGEMIVADEQINWASMRHVGNGPNGHFEFDLVGTHRLAAVQKILDLAEDLADEAELIQPATADEAK